MNFAKTVRCCQQPRAAPKAARRAPWKLPLGLIRLGKRQPGKPAQEQLLPSVKNSPTFRAGGPPPLYTLLPRSDTLRNMIRGRRTVFHGLHKPLGTVVFPAYVLGAAASVVGE